MPNTATLRLPLGILAATQPLDIATTAALLTAGAGHEANPITAALIAVGGLALVLAVKLALTGVIAGGAWHLAKTEPARARRRVLIVAGLYTAVVVWNSLLMLVRL